MATLLKGAEVVEAMNAQTATLVKELKGQGTAATLAIVRVGEREDEIAYERGALKRCEKVGICARQVLLPETATQAQLIAAIEELNVDDSVHGVLLLRPLPPHINDDTVRNVLLPEKDVDGITDKSIAAVFAGEDIGFAPCTPQACMEIAEYFGYEFEGKNAVVIGRSLVVGKPAAMMLLDRNATVTIAHSRTKSLPEIARRADFVIACVGRAEMVDASYLRAGQTVIDVGINVAANGKLTGDVNFNAAESVVDAITPVPGGVGTVTTSVLCKHVAQAAKRHHPS
jgi:methylenetetrahydrofolate dehydrogenase (NADP+)/methenyltetrahydrofolate cyclohydrolase